MHMHMRTHARHTFDTHARGGGNGSTYSAGRAYGGNTLELVAQDLKGPNRELSSGRVSGRSYPAEKRACKRMRAVVAFSFPANARTIASCVDCSLTCGYLRQCARIPEGRGDAAFASWRHRVCSRARTGAGEDMWINGTHDDAACIIVGAFDSKVQMHCISHFKFTSSREIRRTCGPAGSHQGRLRFVRPQYP
jgi:hypothetical protein